MNSGWGFPTKWSLVHESFRGVIVSLYIGTHNIDIVNQSHWCDLVKAYRFCVEPHFVRFRIPWPWYWSWIWVKVIPTWTAHSKPFMCTQRPQPGRRRRICLAEKFGSGRMIALNHSANGAGKSAIEKNVTRRLENSLTAPGSNSRLMRDFRARGRHNPDYFSVE